VEDHDDARTYLRAFLEPLVAKVVTARNASEGLEAVKTYRPNLVLSDISMPGRDGFGLLSDIRALGPDAGGAVPVIAMTAFVTRVDCWSKTISTVPMLSRRSSHTSANLVATVFLVIILSAGREIRHFKCSGDRIRNKAAIRHGKNAPKAKDRGQ
jgi:CheY-like chemotaxis protein